MNVPAIISPAMEARARRLCDIMLAVSGHDPRKQSRLRPVVLARAMVSARLLSEGWTENQVGALMGREHSTVHYYRTLVRSILQVPSFRAERELLELFNQHAEQ